MAQIIQIVSDVVCPWCFIGKRRLERALALLGRPDVQVEWKPFELNPGAPKEGMDRREYRTRKFGSFAYAQRLEARVAAAGAEEGIAFRFDRIARVPNTFDAHRLIWLAGREGVQDAVVERLFQAYFIDGEDVGDGAVLDRIAGSAGLHFAAGVGAAEVSTEENFARLQGINGVPAFFIDGRPVASGAQKAEVLASVVGPALEPVAEQCSLGDGNCG